MARKKIDCRYERKAFVDTLSIEETEALLKTHPSHFRALFEPRYINNLYLDTLDFSNYQANIAGLDRRLKIRVRWYGHLFGKITNPTLEIKHKCGVVGWKERYPLEPFLISDRFSMEDLSQSLHRSEIPRQWQLRLKGLEIKILNRYFRSYYISSCKRFRITVDSDIRHYLLNQTENLFLARALDRGETIVEMKYDADHDDDAESVTSYFPFRLTKISKYIDGIDKLLT